MKFSISTSRATRDFDFVLARISHQSDNQVILGSRNWNQEGKGADGVGVSELWEWKRVSCRMIGLRIA